MRSITRLLCAALLAAAIGAPGARAQRDAVHVEAFGPAVLGSANYERVLVPGVSARAGIGYMPGFDIGARLHAPLMINVIAGRGQHRIEAGVGPVLVYALNRGAEEAPTVERGFRASYAAGTLAYRLEPGENSALHGGIYRLGFTPLYEDGEMHAFFGASAGFYLSALRGSRQPPASALRR